MSLCDFCSQPIPTDVGITHDKTFPDQGARGPVSVRLSFTIPIANGTMGASICTKCAQALVAAMIPSPTVVMLRTPDYETEPYTPDYTTGYDPRPPADGPEFDGAPLFDEPHTNPRRVTPED